MSGKKKREDEEPEETVDGVPADELADRALGSAEMSPGAPSGSTPESSVDKGGSVGEGISAGPPALPAEAVQAIEDYRPHGAELVVADPSDEHAVALTLDKHDEDLVLQEIQGRMMTVMMFDFDGKVDLSWPGVREVVRLLNATGKARISIDRRSLVVEEIREDGIDYYRARVYGEDRVTEDGVFGVAAQPKRMKLKASTAAAWRKAHERDGSKPMPDEHDQVWDVFAYAKAVSKAQRNAFKPFIPERIRQTMIATLRKDKTMLERIKVGTGAEAVAALPPPLDTPEAEALREECRALFRRIRQVDPIRWMVPGQFNALLTRSEWSVERLQEFRAQLEGLLEKAEAS